MTTQAEKDDLLARITKAQSVGATILSNMTQAKKIAEALDVGVTPEPEPDPEPTPEPEPTTSEWPNITNTGIPAGTALKNYTGPSTFTGTVTLTEMDISTDVILAKNANLTLVRCRVHGHVDADQSSAFLTAVDCEFDAGTWGNAAVGFRNMSFTRCDMKGGTTSLNAAENITATDCYLHGQYVSGSAHAGGFLCSGGKNITLTNCTIVCDVKNNSQGGGPSASVNLYGDFATCEHITFDNCFIGATDGGYAASFGWNPGGKPYGDNPNHIIVRNCVFERGRNGKGGVYGTVTSFKASENTNVWEGNVWDDGSPIPSDI